MAPIYVSVYEGMCIRKPARTRIVFNTHTYIHLYMYISVYST